MKYYDDNEKFFFRGSFFDILPEIEREKLRIASIVDIFRKGILNEESHVRHLPTSDTIVFHPDGRCKLNLNSRKLEKRIKDHSLDKFGSFILTETEYDSLPNKVEKNGNSYNLEFSPEEIELYAGRLQSWDEISENPILVAYSRSDLKLLERVKRRVFLENPSHKKMMKLDFNPIHNYDTPIEKICSIGNYFTGCEITIQGDGLFKAEANVVAFKKS